MAADAIRFFANLPIDIRSGQIRLHSLKTATLPTMTPDPPSPAPDGPMLPPRHRPSLENITKDSTELDLWAFEDDLDLTEPPVTQSRTATSRATGGDLPAPRERSAGKQRDAVDTPAESGSRDGSPKAGERIQMNISKARQRNKPNVELVSILKPESEFDELENWDDVPKGPQIEDLPEQETASPEPEPEPEFKPEPTPQPKESSSTAREEPTPAVAEDSEFSPAIRGDATPVSLRPRLGLTHVERIGLLVLVILLAIGGLGTLVVSIMGLPSESERVKATDFPIKGGRVTIASADSYWREPITDGSSPETVRRGTKLLPVIELKVSEGSGAIRVLFRNDERSVEGDAVTRTVRGPGTLVIPATAGFDELGMYAAYRAGGSKPWTIEVYEAASETAAGRDFKKLFEINISTARR